MNYKLLTLFAKVKKRTGEREYFCSYIARDGKPVQARITKSTYDFLKQNSSSNKKRSYKMKRLKSIDAAILALIFAFASISFAQSNSDSTKSQHKMMHDKNHKMHEMMKDSAMHTETMDMHNMRGSDHHMTKKSPLIREGIIDLEAIDENKDGKVFQDQMDWNVISDNPGNCPICEMKLKETTLDQAKKKLLEHGYKVKQ
jgi:hypothetical protein